MKYLELSRGLTAIEVRDSAITASEFIANLDDDIHLAAAFHDPRQTRMYEVVHRKRRQIGIPSHHDFLVQYTRTPITERQSGKKQTTQVIAQAAIRSTALHNLATGEVSRSRGGFYYPGPSEVVEDFVYEELFVVPDTRKHSNLPSEVRRGQVLDIHEDINEYYAQLTYDALKTVLTERFPGII